MAAALRWTGDDEEPVPASFPSSQHRVRGRRAPARPGEFPPDIQADIWRGNELGFAATKVLLSGFATIDAELPGAGGPARPGHDLTNRWRHRHRGLGLEGSSFAMGATDQTAVCRHHGLTVDERLAVLDFNKHGAKPTFPHVPQHALREKGQVSLRRRFEASENLWEERCVHGRARSVDLAAETGLPRWVGAGGQSQDQTRRSQAGARVEVGL
jgi:hypothetical protein